MKKKRLLGCALAAVSAIAVTGLASCDKGVEGAGEEFKVLSLDEIKGTEEAIVVEFWHSFGHNIANELNPLIEDFEKKVQADGYNIEVNVTATGGGYDGLRERVNLGTRSKSIPTMLLGYPDHFADYIANDILLPLDEYVYSSDENVRLAGVTKDENDFEASYWKENILPVDGENKVVGIPFNKSTEIMVYNASLLDPILESKGYLDANKKWTNPTWEQVFEVSKYVKENKDTLKWTYKGAEYSVSADMKYPTYVDSEANFFITASRQWGGDGKYTTLDVATGEGTVVSNNASNKEAMDYFLDKANKGYFQFPGKVSQSYGSNLLQTEAAFISIGSTAGIKNNASKKYELKATGIPQKGYGANDTNAVIQQGTNLAILSANSNNKTRLAAWMLIQYLTSTDITAKFSMNTGYLPVRKSAINSADYQSFLSDESNVFYGQVAKAINAAYAQKDFFYTDPAFTGSSIVRDKTTSVVQDIFIYDKTFDQALKALYDELALLDIKTQ